jgi:hypothetical protein
MTLNPPEIIERLTRVAPLGLRFFDAVTQQVVGGLAVTAWPAATPAQQMPLFANPSGVHVLQHAPGLRDFENGAGDEAFWANIPAKKP